MMNYLKIGSKFLIWIATSLFIQNAHSKSTNCKDIGTSNIKELSACLAKKITADKLDPENLRKVREFKEVSESDSIFDGQVSQGNLTEKKTALNHVRSSGPSETANLQSNKKDGLYKDNKLCDFNAFIEDYFTKTFVLSHRSSVTYQVNGNDRKAFINPKTKASLLKDWTSELMNPKDSSCPELGEIKIAYRMASKNQRYVEFKIEDAQLYANSNAYLQKLVETKLGDKKYYNALVSNHFKISINNLMAKKVNSLHTLLKYAQFRKPSHEANTRSQTAGRE